MRRPSMQRFALVVLTSIICASSLVIQPVRSNSIQQASNSDSIKEAAPKAAPVAEAAEAAPSASSGAAKPASPAAEPERKGRASDAASSKSEPAAAASPKEASKENTGGAKEEKSSSQTSSSSGGSKAQEDKKSSPKPSSAAPKQQSQQSQSAGKSGAQKSKLPANLGTVTSTGSGGPAHYMSKHDAYSAIAEKHGALAHDSVRNTHRVNSDRRSHLQRFGGVQKASGIGDMLNPFKGVTDSGLARTLGASMRSIMKGKYSIPAYVASAVLGAVALMAFYESPISPLPVPPLPEPPVGRFPPEMPNISPNVQVPFRTNQQYGQQAYANQRSFPGGQSALAQQQQQQQLLQQQAQVLFPGATAQQRQMSPAGPVQQLAANLLSSAKQQVAQRKSGLDYEPALSRSFFGAGQASPSGQQKLSAPANQQKQSSSLLSFLGLGSSSPPVAQAADLQAAASAHSSSSSSLEPKGQAAGAAALSNSHVVNKVKSYFARAPSSQPLQAAHGEPSGQAANPYDQYQRMSFMQALAKDTAFLPAFLSPSRKSSPSSPAGGSSPAGASTASAVSKIQQSISNVLSAAAGAASAQQAPPAASAQSVAAASRMQVDGQLANYLPHSSQQHQQQQQSQPSSKRSPSPGYGLMRAADRIAHALLDTFTQRGHAAQHSDGVAARKSQLGADESPLMTTASLLSDIMLSSYSGDQQASASQLVSSLAQAAGLQPASGAASEQQQAASGAPSSSGADESSNKAHQEQSSVLARSDEQASGQTKQVQQAASGGQSGAKQATVAAAQQESHLRKTRSIGLEYPTYELTEQQQQQQQQMLAPSKATQINNLVDLVSDSYKQNRVLFNFVMNRVGLSHALPYVEQILGDHQVPMANQFLVR